MELWYLSVGEFIGMIRGSFPEYFWSLGAEAVMKTHTRLTHAQTLSMAQIGFLQYRVERLGSDKLRPTKVTQKQLIGLKTIIESASDNDSNSETDCVRNSTLFLPLPDSYSDSRNAVAFCREVRQVDHAIHDEFQQDSVVGGDATIAVSAGAPVGLSRAEYAYWWWL